MKLDLGSFALGFVAGSATTLASKRLRPLLLDIATALYRFGDEMVAKAVTRREDLEDLLAEARARARTKGGNGAAEAAEG